MFAYLFAYLVGAIPTGYLLGRSFGIDITKHGSGNIGATNVARVLGSTKYFFLVFFLDFAKAAGFLYLARLLLQPTEQHQLYYAFLLLLGNAYSIFLGFQGGKGVATSFGILVMLFSHYVALVFLSTWLIVFPLARRVDIASLVAIVATTLGAYTGFYKVSNPQLSFLFFLTFFLLLRHRANIRELISRLT